MAHFIISSTASKRWNHLVQRNKQYHRKVLLSSFHVKSHTSAYSIHCTTQNSAYKLKQWMRCGVLGSCKIYNFFFLFHLKIKWVVLHPRGQWVQLILQRWVAFSRFSSFLYISFKLVASCSGSLLCLLISRDLIKEPIVINSEVVSSLEVICVLRASGSLLQYRLHS